MTQTPRGTITRYVADVRRSPGQVLLLLLSLWFVSNGPVAFAICPSFSFGSNMTSCTVMVFGFIPVTANGWHALFHFVTGIAGVVLARRPLTAFAFGLGCGWFYLLVAGLGLAGGNNVVHFMAVDTFGNGVHAFEGGLLITAAALTALSASRQIKHRAVASANAGRSLAARYFRSRIDLVKKTLVIHPGRGRPAPGTSGTA